MQRRTIITVAVAIASFAVLGTGALLLRDDSGEREDTRAAPTGTSDEATFIGTTAAHLCNVQSTVYDDPKALADAYQSTPTYPGFTAERVEVLRKRLVTDAAFSARLTQRLQEICRSAAS